MAEVFRRRRLRSFTLSRNVKLPFSSFFFFLSRLIDVKRDGKRVGDGTGDYSCLLITQVRTGASVFRGRSTTLNVTTGHARTDSSLITARLLCLRYYALFLS